MKKLVIMATILAVILAGILISGDSDKNQISNVYFKTETIAVCDKNNYCEDHTILCDEKNVLKIGTTGYAVQFGESWEDPRTEEEKKFC